ncbi:hypothetical protein DVK02_02240 [Halobellus sp. Atlit-31R]|nr:hypothetical protein DVK02_02240 [Halobellus sp. Atlit-31R]
MSKTCRPAPSASDLEWTVRQVVPRSEWDAATEPCPACGETVDLNGPHYQVELDRERAPGAGSKLTRERRLLSLCDETCATDWLDGAEIGESHPAE